MYGETIGATVDGVREVMQSWLVGGVARGRGGATWSIEAGIIDDGVVLGDVENSDWYGFSSAHPHAVNFAYVDGHVAEITRDTDVTLFLSSCGRADGSL